jgi:broad specificity phosphatase PhoE
MAPNSVLIMRHAEKSEDPMDPDLTEAGQQRAKALATWLPGICPQIDFLFASAISKHSNRPFETIRPLSKKIGVPIDTSFADQDYGALAREVLTDDKYAGKIS